MKSLSHADKLTSGPVKVFSVRLPEAERRRVKSLAASLGLSLQEVVHQALEAWMLQHDPRLGRRRNRPPGAPVGADMDKPARRNDQMKSVRTARNPAPRLRAGG